MNTVRGQIQIKPLRDLELFAGCTNAQLRQIRSLTTLLQLTDGTALTREGQNPRQLMIIGGGKADVYKRQVLAFARQRGAVGQPEQRRQGANLAQFSIGASREELEVVQWLDLDLTSDRVHEWLRSCVRLRCAGGVSISGVSAKHIISSISICYTDSPSSQSPNGRVGREQGSGRVRGCLLYTSRCV